MSRIPIKSTLIAVLAALTGLDVTAAPAGAATVHSGPQHAILKAILLN